MALPGLSKSKEKDNTDKHQDITAKTFFASTPGESVTMMSAEKELMHRVLETIEQMLCEVSGSSQWIRCFPFTPGVSAHSDEWMTTIGPETLSQCSRPEQSAYFCLTSASALVDVTRSLLDHMDEARASDAAAGWPALSELSKAAGQSAYLASVILAGRDACRGVAAGSRYRAPRPRAAKRGAGIVGRSLGRLMGLFESRQAMRLG